MYTDHGDNRDFGNFDYHIETDSFSSRRSRLESQVSGLLDLETTNYRPLLPTGSTVSLSLKWEGNGKNKKDESVV